MGYGDAVDGEWLAAYIGEFQEAADVVVLVIAGEDSLGFGSRESEGGKSNGLAKFAGVLKVDADEFAQRHERSAASGFSADAVLLRLSVLCEGAEGKRMGMNSSGHFEFF